MSAPITTTDSPAYADSSSTTTTPTPPATASSAHHTPGTSAIAQRATPLKTRTPIPARARTARQHTFPRTLTPRESSSSSSQHQPSADGGEGSSTPQPVARSPPPPQRHQYSPSSPTPVPKSALRPAPITRSATEGDSTPVAKGKRKAEDDGDRTPPDQKGSVRATRFADWDSRGQLISDASQVSNYRKRPRTSGPTTPARSSTPGSSEKDSPESRTSSTLQVPPRAPSRARSNRASVQASVRSARSARTAGADSQNGGPGSPTRSLAHRASGSHMSTASVIPVRALVTPHAPSVSVGRAAGTPHYHMRDPRRPQTRPTPWVPRLRSRAREEPGSPIHAWLFYAGFAFFPLWWFASVLGVPTTRTVGGSDTEKAVFVDDPQIEHDARSWRNRCRIASVVAFFTYIPFIVLVSYFATR